MAVRREAVSLNTSRRAALSSTRFFFRQAAKSMKTVQLDVFCSEGLSQVIVSLVGDFMVARIGVSTELLIDVVHDLLVNLVRDRLVKQQFDVEGAVLVLDFWE